MDPLDYQNALPDFIRNAGDDWGWQEVSCDTFCLKSQTWQGTDWVHSLKIVHPEHPIDSDVVMMEITGGPMIGADLRMAQLAANQSGLRVAVLFDIPFQPMWDMIEDDLIAHTLAQTFETGDTSWPLLFPMTLTAIRAVDTLEQITQQKLRVIYTGASKRGWTAWLAGLMDAKRTAAIIPRVFDNLNMVQQLQHQISLWGEISPMLDDYTRRSLHILSTSERGRELAQMIDPMTFLDRISAPVLIVTGSNDLYWAVDAGRLYSDSLPSSASFHVVPNMGHWVGDAIWNEPTIAHWARMVAQGNSLPSLRVSARDTLGIQWTLGEAAHRVNLFRATSESFHFHNSLWQRVASWRDLESAECVLPLTGPNNAFFLSADFYRDGRMVRITSVPWIMPAVA